MKKNIIHVIYPNEMVYSFVTINDMSVEDNLERVFAEWNHGSGMECELFIQSKKRSLSVNDIVAVNGVYYQCASFGWNKVSVDFVNQLEKEVAIHPYRFVHGAWFALNEVMWGHRHDSTEAQLEGVETV
jgi:hypothetical protein